jgi:hypothetical protein
MHLPTRPEVLTLAATSSSGWEGYDRGARDHLADARRALAHGDRYGYTYWAHRALRCAVATYEGARYGTGAEWLAFGERAARILEETDPEHDPRALEDFRRTADRAARLMAGDAR